MGRVNRKVLPSPSVDVGGELPAVGLHQALADPEPEAGAGGPAVVAPEELGEHAGQVLGGDALAGVADRDRHRRRRSTSPVTRIALGLPYLAAFSTRLVSTCSTLSGSA